MYDNIGFMVFISKLWILQGVVISEKEYYKGSQFTGYFSYYYQVKIKERVYKNPTYDSVYQVGDTVVIEYNEYLPFINRIRTGHLK